MKLFLEFSDGTGPVQVPNGGDFAAFLAFAVMRGFGAQHPLIALADRLHDAYHVPMGPLTLFYEAGPEDSEDREKLELAWQPEAALRSVLEAALPASEDAQSQALIVRAGTPAVFQSINAVIGLLRSHPNTNVRMTYAL